MTASYEQYLTKDHIEAVRRRFGFDDALRVERHIMDFKIHQIISDGIPMCIRGGMAASFYTPGSFSRLSEDIDVYAFETAGGIRAHMRSLGADLGAIGITVKEHKPAGGGLQIPLVTYFLEYTSAMETYDQVKIDILCDTRLEHLPRREFRPPVCLGHFAVLHTVSALDAGALVADKITSLSVGTIGYPPAQRHKTNKQIYDIGQMLRQMSDEHMAQAISEYAGLALHKGRYTQEHGSGPAHDVDSITNGTCKFLLSVLRPGDRFGLDSKFKDTFGAFKGAHLGRRPYSKSTHQTDALLTLLFASVLLEHGRGTMDAAHAAGTVRSAADVLKLMSNRSTRGAGKERIDATAVPNSPLEASIRNLPLESKYLLRQISSVRRGLI